MFAIDIQRFWKVLDFVAPWLERIEHNFNLFQAYTSSDHNHIKNWGKGWLDVFKSQFTILSFSLSINLMNFACKLGKVKNVFGLSDLTVQHSCIPALC